MEEGGETTAFSESELLKRQLVYADKVLLNKIDLLPGGTDLEHIKELVRKVNPTAAIRETLYAQTPLEFLIEKVDKVEVVKHECSGGCIHTEGSQMSDIQSVHLEFEGGLFDRDSLEQYMGVLLWEKADGQQVMRCKGSFLSREGDRRVEQMLQGVDEVFEFREVGEGAEKKQHRFLFVGRQLKEAALREAIARCLIIDS